MRYLVFDVGNTNIKGGIFVNDKIKDNFIFDERTQKKILKYTFNKIFIISVNKKNCKSLTDYLLKNGYEFKILSKKKESFISEYSFENIGIDRFVAIYYSIKKKIYPSIIIDLGTADTFDFIDPYGKHLGGFISAGLKTLSLSLSKNTDLLFDVEFDSSDQVIGKDTSQALTNGLYLQWLSGLLTFIGFGKRLLDNPQILITGGNSDRLKDFVKDGIFDKDFLLKAILEYGKDFFN